jgi:hypothetical protein
MIVSAESFGEIRSDPVAIESPRNFPLERNHHSDGRLRNDLAVNSANDREPVVSWRRRRDERRTADGTRRLASDGVAKLDPFVRQR